MAKESVTRVHGFRRGAHRVAPLFALLITMQPVNACHLFKRWHYPWPQRCGIHMDRHVIHAKYQPKFNKVPAVVLAYVAEGVIIPPLTYIEWSSSDDTPIRLKLLGIGRTRLMGELQ